MEDTHNTLFPGRPGYTGPIEGWFGFIHHTVLFERSHNIMKRINYIKKHKPKNEIPTRLNHLISLAALSPLLNSFQSKRAALNQEYQSEWDALDREYQPKWDALDQIYQPKWGTVNREYLSKWDALYQEYISKGDILRQKHQSKWDALTQEFQPTILNYIKQHIPNCAWDGNQLQFPVVA